MNKTQKYHGGLLCPVVSILQTKENFNTLLLKSVLKFKKFFKLKRERTSLHSRLTYVQ